MAQNLHASAVVLGDRGIVITGESGSGKAQLAMALLDHARANGHFARLVADDQLFLMAYGGRVLCSAPPAISGLIEVRGLGPHAIAYESRAPVDLLVRLVDPAIAERFPEHATAALAGCAVALLELAYDDLFGARMAVLARLSMPPFA